MVRKATGALIFLPLLISVTFCEVDQHWVSFGLDQEIGQDPNQNPTTICHMRKELGYILPFQNGINIINSNGGNNPINQDFNQKDSNSYNGFETPEITSQPGFNLVNSNDANLQIQDFSRTQESPQAINYYGGIGYPTILYAINFTNIIYGDVSKESHPGIPANSDNFPNHKSLQETMERLAKLASIHELERKENLELLKRIASPRTH